MSKTDIKRHTIQCTAPLIEGLGKLNALPGDEMTLLVEDKCGRVTGTLTDGDVRRAILRGLTAQSPVDEATHHCFLYAKQGEVDIEFIRDCRVKGITVVPVLDSDGRLVDIINLNRTHTVLPVRAVLMAGGKGERLRPLTDNTPKPLLEIDGKAIIDYNIEALSACGVDDITVCTRYLSEKIEEHCSAPIAGVTVKCVKEETPLGTIGGVSLIDNSGQGDTIVMNSDLLTTISFEELYLHHKAQCAMLTVAVIPYQVSVPYAILNTEGSRVTGIDEKPSYSYYANAGIYIINNTLLNKIEPNTRLDATDLVQQAIDRGQKVTFFPVNGTWIDVGTPVDFRQAADLMRHHRNMSRAGGVEPKKI